MVIAQPNGKLFILFLNSCTYFLRSAKIKGSSGNMGARRMSRLAAELQNVEATPDLPEAARLIEHLEEEFGRVRLALQAELGRSG